MGRERLVERSGEISISIRYTPGILALGLRILLEHRGSDHGSRSRDWSRRR